MATYLCHQNGRMEYWNVGILGVKAEINHFNCKKLLQTHYSIISSFHYSNWAKPLISFYCHQKSLLFTGSKLSFSPFIKTGSDSFVSSLPQRIRRSLHIIQPKKGPCFLSASIQYCEHDGYMGQRLPSAPEI